MEGAGTPVSLADSILLSSHKLRTLLAERQQRANRRRENGEDHRGRRISAFLPADKPTGASGPEAAADHEERGADEQGAAPSSGRTPHEPTPVLSKPPRSFYATSAQRLRQVEDRVLRFLSNVRQRVDIGAGSGRPGAPAPWQSFPTQQAAFDFADALDPGGERLRIFSAETGPNARRRFLATSYAELWRRYREMLPHQRHFYEIIRERRPCHLYLDLEFDVAANPGRSGQSMVDATLSLLRELLEERLALDLQDAWVLELDSSTEAKFSRHVIVRAPGAAFASNAHVGALVAELAERVKARRGEDERCAALVVEGREGRGEALFIDTGVYSRNRAFRLHLSSKAGKAATLLPTGRFAGAELTTQQAFFRALVCNVDPAATLLRCFDECAPPAATAAAAAKQRAGGARGSGSGGGGVGVAQTGPSPYPQLDAFVESVCVEGGVQGRVRSWVSLDGGALLLFNMRDNRFCGNLGRAHRSNGVFYVVDLHHGAWYQKCYDPECRRYRSPAAPLPPHLLGLWQPPEAELGADSAAAAEDAEEAEQAEGAGAGEAAWSEDDDGWDEETLAAVDAAEQRHQAHKRRREIGGEAASAGHAQGRRKEPWECFLDAD